MPIYSWPVDDSVCAIKGFPVQPSVHAARSLRTVTFKNVYFDVMGMIQPCPGVMDHCSLSTSDAGDYVSEKGKAFSARSWHR